MRPVNKRKPRVWFPEAVDVIAAEKNYDTARHLLVQAIGPYCSYCEAPLSVDVPVEHKVAKSGNGANFTMEGRSFAYTEGFPASAFAWVNFLLACSSCNASKGAHPGSAEAFQRLPIVDQPSAQRIAATLAANTPLQPADVELLYTTARDSWVFPDTTQEVNGAQVGAAGAPTYQLLTTTYEAASQVELAAQGLVRIPNGQQNQPWATTRHTMLWVIPNTAYLNTLDPGIREDALMRIRTTISQLNLNRYNADDKKYNDRRVLNRTGAYQQCLDALTALSGLITQLRAGGAYDFTLLVKPSVQLLVSTIRETVRATGFWSVWAQQFQRAMKDPADANWSGFPDEAKQALFRLLFIAYEVYGRIRQDGDGPVVTYTNTLSVFPGTDAARVPW